MGDVEQSLRELAGKAAWPDTPDLATAVRARLDAPVPPAARSGILRPWAGRRRRLLVAVLAALAALPAAALALPGPRHAILETLGLRHVTVQRRPGAPSGAGPRLGTRATLASAPRLAGFAAQVPAALGPPDRVFVNQGIVTLLYEPEHVLLAQARGTLEREVLRKVISVDARIRPVRVNGHRGIYLPARHEYLWTDATGPPVRSGPALVWEQDGRVLRLEGARSLAAAVAIAETVG